MLPDFEIIQHNLYGGHDIVIYPIADVHLGAPDQMEQEFMQFLDRLKDEPNAYITLGGDLLNVATKNSLSNVYRERYMFSEAKKMMAEMLEPVKDKILCAVCGNHERRTMREVDVDPMYDIMVLLGKEHLYRENIAFVTIRTGEPNTANGKRRNGIYRPVYNLVVCHGSGGGVRQLLDNMASILDSLPEDENKRAEITEILDELMEGVLSTTGHLSGELSQRIGNEIMID